MIFLWIFIVTQDFGYIIRITTLKTYARNYFYVCQYNFKKPFLIFTESSLRYVASWGRLSDVIPKSWNCVTYYWKRNSFVPNPPFLYPMKISENQKISTVCSCHVTYTFQSESTLFSCLNVKELLAQSRHKIWSLSDCNWTRAHNHLVHKWTLNHLAKLTKRLSFTVSTYL